MKNEATHPRQVCRFRTPRRIVKAPDQFGCAAFTSYGFIQRGDGTVIHIKNPDFNWRKFRSAPFPI